MDLETLSFEELNQLLEKSDSYDERRAIRKVLRNIKGFTSTPSKSTPVSHDFAKNRMTQKIIRQSVVDPPSQKSPSQSHTPERKYSLDSPITTTSRRKSNDNLSGPSGLLLRSSDKSDSRISKDEGRNSEFSEARLKREKELKALTSKSKFDNHKSKWEQSRDTGTAERPSVLVPRSDAAARRRVQPAEDVPKDQSVEPFHRKDESITDSAYSTEETVSNRDEISDFKSDSHSEKELTPSTEQDIEEELGELERYEEEQQGSDVVEELVVQERRDCVESVPEVEHRLPASPSTSDSGSGTYFGLSVIRKEPEPVIGNSSREEYSPVKEDTISSGWHDDDEAPEWSSALAKLSSRNRKTHEPTSNIIVAVEKEKKTSRGLGNRLAGLSAYYADGEDDNSLSYDYPVSSQSTKIDDDQFEQPTTRPSRENRLKGLATLYNDEDNNDNDYPVDKSRSRRRDIDSKERETASTIYSHSNVSENKEPLQTEGSGTHANVNNQENVYKNEQMANDTSSRRSRIRSLVDESERIRQKVVDEVISPNNSEDTENQSTDIQDDYQSAEDQSKYQSHDSVESTEIANNSTRKVRSREDAKYLRSRGKSPIDNEYESTDRSREDNGYQSRSRSRGESREDHVTQSDTLDMKPVKPVSEGVTKRLQQIHSIHEEAKPATKKSPMLKGDVSGIKARFQQQGSTESAEVPVARPRKPMQGPGHQRPSSTLVSRREADRTRQDNHSKTSHGPAEVILRKTAGRTDPLAETRNAHKTRPTSDISYRDNLRKTKGPATHPKPKRAASHRVERMSSVDLSIEDTEHALVNLVNKELSQQTSAMKYLPIKSFEDMCSKFTDGVLLCKLVNWSVTSTVDVRALTPGILTTAEKRDNLVLAVESARSIGAVVRDDTVEQLLRCDRSTVKQILLDLLKAHQVHKLHLEDRRSMSIDDFANHVQACLQQYL